MFAPLLETHLVSRKLAHHLAPGDGTFEGVLCGGNQMVNDVPIPETLGWGRVVPPGGFGLRRGAWNRIMEDEGQERVVIDIVRAVIEVPRKLLEIRRHLPARFSVVVRTFGEANPVRGTPLDLGLVYAVCPLSRSRVRLADHPAEVQCPECGHHYSVAWEREC